VVKLKIVVSCADRGRGRPRHQINCRSLTSCARSWWQDSHFLFL